MSFGVRRRARRADQFVQIENAFLRDESLSIEARGVGAYLLTHAEEFRVSALFLAKATKLGRDKLRRVLRELETAGYLVREHARDGGRFAEDEYSMSDEKAEVGTGDWKAAAVNQSPVITPHKNTTSENTKDQEDQQDSCPSADGPAPSESRTVNAIIDAEFADWWEAYPRKIAKGQAERAYRTARKNGVSQADLLEGLAAANRAWTAARTEKQFKPYPATWLNGKRWLDDMSAVGTGGTGSPARRTQPGPGVVHTAEERAQQQESFAAMPQATPITPEELEALFRDQ